MKPLYQRSGYISSRIIKALSDEIKISISHTPSAFLTAALVSCSPISTFQQRAEAISPVIGINFPDPATFQDTDNTWYAFATNGIGKNVQVAQTSSPSGPWTILDNDLLPIPGAWSNEEIVWAPDVGRIGSTYVMYYSATDAAQTAQHCVGTATSDTVLRPYTAADAPPACPLSAGGGFCGNTVAPVVPTPLMLQQLADDGTTPVRDPVGLLDRDDADGPLIEAPNLILVNGVYAVFFSSNCYSKPQYDISYATASAVFGPFTKSSAPLMVTNNSFDITAPGGAQVTDSGRSLVFHANCDAGRCMFERAIEISGTQVSINSRAFVIFETL